MNWKKDPRIESIIDPSRAEIVEILDMLRSNSTFLRSNVMVKVESPRRRPPKAAAKNPEKVTPPLVPFGQGLKLVMRKVF